MRSVTVRYACNAPPLDSNRGVLSLRGGGKNGRSRALFTTPHPNSGKVLLMQQRGPLPEGSRREREVDEPGDTAPALTNSLALHLDRFR